MIFDLGVGWPSKELKDGHKNEINCVQFSQDEKLIASFSFQDKKLIVWKVSLNFSLFNLTNYFSIVKTKTA